MSRGASNHAHPNVVVPLIQGAARKIKRADRTELIDIYDQYRRLKHEQIRRLVVEHNRTDVLAVVVLGYEVEPMHLALMRFQFLHRDTLQLCFRGAGKTTVCTVTKAIHYLIKNRDFRVLIGSKTQGNSKGMLKEIKGHLEGNALLAEIFGSFYDPSRVGKWDESEIEVLGKKKATKEASITCVGVDSAVVSKHYDAHLCDDLVDENNARTQYMRDQTKVWYYQTLVPTLEPPDDRVPHRGESHKQGTHYHFADLYSHLEENECKDCTQIIPALDEKERSPWPRKYPPSWFKAKRKIMGNVLFNAQYQCNTDAMKGEVFHYDDCQQIDDDEFPAIEKMKVYAGVDLAITEEEQNDQYADIVLGIIGKPFDPTAIYVLDYFAGHIRFSAQTDRIIEVHKKWKPIRTGIESNAYQRAQIQTVKEKEPLVRAFPLYTDKDKMTRAWKISPHFENKRVFFRKNVQGPVIDQLVMFPHYRLKDLFDAFDNALAIARKKRKRRSERKEPGLLG